MTMPLNPSNYPPGVSGNEPQIAGGQGVYLKHTQCGEVFDNMDDAAIHMLMAGADDDGDAECMDENEWELIPEEEAF